MSIASEINRLQTAKAGLKTAIEGKGVTVPSGSTLEDYPSLVSGIRAPYILNPLNGSELGSPSQNGGTYQHQYEISYGNIVNARLFKYEFSLNYTVVDLTLASTSGFKELHFLTDSLHNTGNGAQLLISANGLLSLILEANSQNWQKEYSPYGVILTTDDNTNLIDYFIPYAWWTCFVKNTPITLFDGTRKPVQDVTYDDELLVWDFDNGTMSHAKPLWIQSARRASEYKLVTLDDGKQLRLVGAGENCHRLFCVEDGAFVYANNMVGKTTVYENGTQHKVVSCEAVKDDVEYYNIITDYHMNLYADEVLTSCRYSNLYPIKDMAYVKDTRDLIPIDEYKASEEYYYGMRLGESCINPKDTIAYLANLEAFRTVK